MTGPYVIPGHHLISSPVTPGSRSAAQRSSFWRFPFARPRDKALSAATAYPAAAMRANSLVIAADSLTVPRPADKTEGGKRRFLPGLNAGISASPP